jgi:DNA-binding response OmpR family regulator
MCFYASWLRNSLNIVLTCGRSAPARSKSVYLDFKRHEVSRGKHRVGLWPKSFMMISAILVSPQRLTTRYLIAHIYADQPDGGPLWADRCVWHCIWHARQRLKPLGIDFKAIHWSGYDPVDLWA